MVSRMDHVNVEVLYVVWRKIRACSRDGDKKRVGEAHVPRPENKPPIALTSNIFVIDKMIPSPLPGIFGPDDAKVKPKGSH